MNIGQTPVSEQYFNGQMTAAQLLGMNAGAARAPFGGGQGLPGSTTVAGDRAAVWWHPHSHAFWAIIIGVLAIGGMAGADTRVRLGRGRAGVNVGTT